MRCRLLSSLVFFVVVLALNGCAAPTAVPTATVPPPTALIAAPATIAPTAVPPTAAQSATRAAAPPTQAPTATTQPTQAAQTKPTTASSSSGPQLDLNKLIPPGDGRDLVMDNCMSCHSIAPVLVSQKTAGEWEGTKNNHRAAIAHLSDADYGKLFGYLIKNFGPDHQVPNLPPELLSGWTNY